MVKLKFMDIKNIFIFLFNVFFDVESKSAIRLWGLDLDIVLNCK